jgi:ornithine carbamoyltransferase
VNSIPDFKSLNTPTGLSDAQAEALLSMAKGLKATWAPSEQSGLLRGTNIALVSGAHGVTDDAAVFERAATQLGARVARIRASDAGLGTAAELKATAKVFGRLYDAVECQGLDRQVVAQLEAHAGIVVYNALGSARHEVFSRLWPLMLHDTPGACAANELACRQVVIQAVLLGTLR